MDEPGLEPARLCDALHGLGRLNWISNSAGVLWPEIAALARRTAAPLRVLDLATGGGDVPIRLFLMARRAGLPIRFDGCDLSANSLEFAERKAAEVKADVGFFTLDALVDPIPDQYDVITTSLFLHHLDAEQAVALLQRMGRAAQRLALVNDLVRNYPSFLLVRLGCWLLSRSPVVHVDGPRSVRAAFTAAEARELAERAGLAGAVVKRHYPCRWLLRWERT